MQLLALVVIAVFLVGSGWLAGRMARAGLIAASTAAIVMIGRIPISVALLGFAAGASPLAVAVLTSVSATGALLGYRLVTWSLRQT